MTHAVPAEPSSTAFRPLTQSSHSILNHKPLSSPIVLTLSSRLYHLAHLHPSPITAWLLSIWQVKTAFVGTSGPGPAIPAGAMKSSYASRSDFQKTYLPISWLPSFPHILPHRIRRRLRSKVRSRQSPSTSLASLETSFSPADTLRSLRTHRWSFYDGQYLILIILNVFSLSIIASPGPLFKTAVSTLALLALILPITRQFFLPFLFIATWLIFFYACG